SLEQRLRARARERWPQIASLQIRHRGVFSYVDATLTDATTLKLCRLRYVGSAHDWQFAIYRASHDDYDESVFFTGLPVGTCQDALDTACGLDLNDPTAWTRHPTNLRARPLRLAVRQPGIGLFVPKPGKDARYQRGGLPDHQPGLAGHWGSDRLSPPIWGLCLTMSLTAGRRSAGGAASGEFGEQLLAVRGRPMPVGVGGRAMTCSPTPSGHGGGIRACGVR